ncbi:MAG: biotin--[acetyl-CoA-carboxylase] ligase [Clostridiales bacterium]|jgi:BirA family biotin operon repressor/biotin-[acetyl-CoA-carboxylase] ligase|nr:biotin--[acetyl-CoA-carboxylase] ligase [Clostridiales bacterium]
MLSKQELFNYTGISSIHIFESISSTNNYAKTIKAYPAIVAANKQTEGRGRYGKSFYSPENGIYFSVALKNDFGRDILYITPTAAVAVCMSIKKLSGTAPKIKWVNDIYINNRKVSGILTESTGPSIIIGIGINFYGQNNTLPSHIRDKAGFLFESKPGFDRNLMISEIFNTLYNYLNERNFQLYMQIYKELSLAINKKIKFSLNGGVFNATVKDIADDGAIILEIGGSIEKYYSGEISIILPEGVL